MAAAVVVQALVLLLILSVVAAEANVLKVRLRTLQQSTAVGVEGAVQPLLALD